MFILETDQTGQVVREDQSTRTDQIVTTGNKILSMSLCFNKIISFYFYVNSKSESTEDLQTDKQVAGKKNKSIHFSK